MIAWARCEWAACFNPLWKTRNHVQKFAQAGAWYDLLTAAMGVAASIRSPEHAAFEGIRALCLIGYIGSTAIKKYAHEPAVDPQADIRPAWQRMFRPMQYPIQTAFAFFAVNALARLANGIGRRLAAGGDMLTGAPDILVGGVLLLGFMGRVFLHEPSEGPMGADGKRKRVLLDYVEDGVNAAYRGAKRLLMGGRAVTGRISCSTARLLSLTQIPAVVLTWGAVIDRAVSDGIYSPTTLLQAGAAAAVTKAVYHNMMDRAKAPRA